MPNPNLIVFLILFFAPLVRGGNRPIALMILELLGLSLLAWLIITPHFKWQPSKKQRWFMGLLIAYPLLQLIPIPFDLWQTLSGHAYYASALQEAGISASGTWLPGSMAPEMTLYSLMTLIPAVAIFIFIASSGEEKSASLCALLVGMAIFEALLGLAQAAYGPDTVLRLGWYHTGASAAGTYANRDHLAGMLEMILPLALALLASNARYHFKSPHPGGKGSIVSKLSHASSWHVSRFTFYTTASIIILLGLIFTQSRSGVAIGMVVILLSALIFSVKLKNNQQAGLIFSVTAVGIGFAIELGLVPILKRFALEDPLSDSRWVIYSDTSKAISQFFPFGSGAGTFSQVFERFQSQDLLGVFINHAHNDYLEWLMEGGVVTVILIVSFIALFTLQLATIWSHKRWSTVHYLQMGAGIGIVAMGLHSLSDFNLHIPANQIFFAALCGLFFRPTEKEIRLNDTNLHLSIAA